MLQDNIITKLLGLSSVSIDKFEKINNENYIYVSTKKSKQICPCCGKETSYIHDYRIQKIKDLLLYGNNSYLILKKDDMFVRIVVNASLKTIIFYLVIVIVLKDYIFPF